MYTCANCPGSACRNGRKDNLPINCPSKEEDLENSVLELYSDAEDYKLAYNSALVEAEGYCKKTRLEEIIDFAHKCNFHKIGLAFCVGLNHEAKKLNAILQHNGFEVVSVACKNGCFPKEELKIKDEEKVRPGSFEAMCNPIGQAALLNKEKTELNIILGLCVGHDSLFMKHSQAPVTVFAVKDRVLGHNPLAAIYLSDGYYKNKLYKD